MKKLEPTYHLKRIAKMSSSRKQLRMEIAELEKILQQQKNQAMKLEKHIKTTTYYHHITWLTLLLTAFLFGWFIGRKNKIHQIGKKLIELSFFIVTSYIKQRIK